MNSGEWVQDFEDSVRQIVRQEIEASVDGLVEKVARHQLQQIRMRTGTAIVHEYDASRPEFVTIPPGTSIYPKGKQLHE